MKDHVDGAVFPGCMADSISPAGVRLPARDCPAGGQFFEEPGASDGIVALFRAERNLHALAGANRLAILERRLVPPAARGRDQRRVIHGMNRHHELHVDDVALLVNRDFDRALELGFEQPAGGGPRPRRQILPDDDRIAALVAGLGRWS